MIMFTANDSSEGEEKSLDPSEDATGLIFPAHCVPPGDRGSAGKMMKVS